MKILFEGYYLVFQIVLQVKGKYIIYTVYHILHTLLEKKCKLEPFSPVFRTLEEKGSPKKGSLRDQNLNGFYTEPK